LGIFWLAQRWQLADLPAKHAQVRLSQLQPLASLLQAVAANDRAEVIRLLDQGAPLNLAMPGEGSALMVAVNHGLFEQVELLLARGADVEVSSRGDGNALIIAASRGDLQLAKRLLDAGANVNAAVLADETALINASYRDDFAMVQLLLNHGADINLQVETPISDGPEIRSPLSRARTPEMRKYLIAKGAR
jgi:ankyrin repeat protein